MCATLAALSRLPDENQNYAPRDQRNPNRIWEERYAGFSERISYRLFIQALRTYLKTGKSIVEKTVLSPGETILVTPASGHCVLVPSNVEYSIVRAVEVSSEGFLQELAAKGCLLKPYTVPEPFVSQQGRNKSKNKRKRRRSSEPQTSQRRRSQTSSQTSQRRRSQTSSVSASTEGKTRRRSRTSRPPDRLDNTLQEI